MVNLTAKYNMVNVLLIFNVSAIFPVPLSPLWFSWMNGEFVWNEFNNNNNASLTHKYNSVNCYWLPILVQSSLPHHLLFYFPASFLSKNRNLVCKIARLRSYTMQSVCCWISMLLPASLLLVQIDCPLNVELWCLWF